MSSIAEQQPLVSSSLYGGEAGASPIALVSPTQRQSSLSPHILDDLGSSAGTTQQRKDESFFTGGDIHDELRSIDTIFSTLSASLNFYQRGPNSGSGQAALQRDGAEVATPEDAKDYISLFCAVLTSAVAHSRMKRGDGTLSHTSAESTVTQLLFENSHDVIGTLSEFISPQRKAYIPSRSTRDSSSSSSALPRTHDEARDEFHALRIAATNALKLIVTTCVDIVQSSGRQQRNLHSSGNVLSLLYSATSRCGTLRLLLSCVTAPTMPEATRVACVECLFLLMMKCPHFSSASEGKPLVTTFFDPLLRVMQIDPCDMVRSYSAAMVRQIALGSPESTVVTRSVPSLLRCLSQDGTSDVRALCCGSIEAIVRRAASEFDHASIAIADIVDSASSTLDAVCSASTGNMFKLSADRGEEEEEESAVGRGNSSAAATAELIEGLCGLFEACTCFALSTVSSDVLAIFKVMIQRGVVGWLARLTQHSSTSAAGAAARALRLMVLRAPPLLQIPALVAEPLCSGSIVKGVVTVAPQSALLLDIALIVGTSLLFSPICRSLWRVELQHYSGNWKEVFLDRMQAALNTAPLSIFSDVIIVDESGAVLSDPDGVEWDDEIHPSLHSIRCVMDAQEVRRRGGIATPQHTSSLSSWRSIEQQRRHDSPRRGYLSFVLLGYCLCTFTEQGGRPSASVTGPSAGSTRRQAGEGRHIDPMMTPNAADSSTLTTTAAAPVGGDKMRRQLFPNPNSAQRGGITKVPAPTNNNDSVRGPRNVTNDNATQRSATEGPSAAVGGHPFDALKKGFDDALRLTIHFSEHYYRKRLSHEEIGASFKGLHRSPHPSSNISTNTSTQSSRKLHSANPFAKPQISQGRSMQLRVWTPAVVEEGDLFFFSIPLSALSNGVVEAVVAKARKHQSTAKKMFLTTPQSQRERRWFLLDMHSIVMPKLVALLLILRKMLTVHSEEAVRLALTVLPSVNVPVGPAGDVDAVGSALSSNNTAKAITCANLLHVTNFLNQCFVMRVSSPDRQPSDGQLDTSTMPLHYFAPLFPPQGSSREGPPNNGRLDGQADRLHPPFDVSPSSDDNDDHEEFDEGKLLFDVGSNRRQQRKGDAIPREGNRGSHNDGDDSDSCAEFY